MRTDRQRADDLTINAHPPIPAYLTNTYSWAYLNPRSVRLLDRAPIVSLILFNNAQKLMQMAINEISAGQRVLQAACVYGNFTQQLAEKIGPSGSLDVIDVAPVQISNLQRKLAGLTHVRTSIADLSSAGTFARIGQFDSVCCFFLLHEVPSEVRARIVHNLLGAVVPGGKIIFVDYHRPNRWHPLRPLMASIFRWLEPYAASLLTQNITKLSPLGQHFNWLPKRTLYGGLYQIITGCHSAADSKNEKKDAE